MNKLSQDEWIQKAIEIYTIDLFDYSLVKYTKTKDKVVIICKVCNNTFEQEAKYHLYGTGCPYCKNITTETWVEKAKNIHGDKYDYSLVNYVNSTTKVTIICPMHGKLQQYPSNHLIGNGGCIKCNTIAQTYTNDEYINKAKLKHHNKYDYSLTKYAGSGNKIIVICPKHTKFEIKANAHLSGQGCRECQYSGKHKTGRKTLEKFIEDAIYVHNNKYDYSKSIYVSSKHYIEIHCPDHGLFLQKPNAHLRGKGCLQCGNIKLRKTLEEFIDEANIVHDFKYDYSKSVYVTGNIKLIIKCPVEGHGEFEQLPFNHLNGTGCPICRSSKGELAVRKVLKRNNYIFKQQQRFDECKLTYPLPFDFYLPQYNLLIEYDGLQHFEPYSFGSDKSEETKLKNFENIQIRDAIKNKFCEDNNIRLLRIPYWDFKNVETILTNYITSIR